jgi:vitamin B12 transporter
MSALVMALAAVYGQAQAQTASLKATVVTASLLEQKVEDALPSTTLITREQIERAHTSDLPTLLRQVAGVEVKQNGGRGTLASAFIRGGSSSHTLVLIDGVPVTNLNFGTAALEHLPLGNVERIEVVRGTVSSLYGSSALGGVIQIFTREGSQKPYANVDVQIGPRGFNQQQAGAGLLTSTGTYFSLNTEFISDRGFNATNQSQIAGTNPDSDGYKRKAYSFGISQKFDNGKVGLTVRESRGATEYDSQFGPSTQADISKYVEKGYTLSAQYKLRPDLTVDAAAVQSKDLLNADVTQVPYYVNSSSTGERVGLKWELAKGQTLTGGYEDIRSTIESDTNYTRKSLTHKSTRMGYQGQWNAHQVQFNVRHDDYQAWDKASTYYAGYGYQFADAWRVAASKATGFKVPTFNDLYSPFGGNANLRPERVDTREINLQYASNQHSVRATYFDSRYTDLIGNDAFFNRINVDKARNKGVELTYTGKFGATQVQAGLTVQNPKDDSNGKQLASRSKQLANIGLVHEFGAWSFGPSVKYASARYDDAANTAAKQMGGYTVIDFSGRYAINKELSAYARIENLADKSYQTVYGYNQPKRGLYLGLNWQPKL